MYSNCYKIENGPSLQQIIKLCYITNPGRKAGLNLPIEVRKNGTRQRYRLNVYRINRVDPCYTDDSFMIPEDGCFEFSVDVECNGKIHDDISFTYNISTREGYLNTPDDFWGAEDISWWNDPLSFMQAI